MKKNNSKANRSNRSNNCNENSNMNRCNMNKNNNVRNKDSRSFELDPNDDHSFNLR